MPVVMPLRHAAIAFVLMAAFLTAFAASADAATVRATPSIQGAGTVTGDHGGFSCGSAIQDDRRTATCPQVVKVEDWHPFDVGMSFTATPSANPSGRWSFVGWLGCDTVTGPDSETCHVTAPGGGSANWFPKAIFDDSANPIITLGPTAIFSTTVERRVFFQFGANETDSSYSCRIDSGPFTSCWSGDGYTLEPGTRTFEVRATDPSGQASSVASRTIRVIDTALDSGPSGLTNSRSATFTFSTEGGTDLKCSLNGGGFSDCSSGEKTYTGLLDGNYQFRVRGTADGGWFDRIPAVRTWRVDATPPQTELLEVFGTPEQSVATTATTATFDFSSEPASSFECSVDGGAFASCSPPLELTEFAPGAHDFRVRAKDNAGNVDATPAQRSWTVLAPDGDGDGARADVDCDDEDPSVRPGAEEIPGNGVDDDCVGGDANVVPPGGGEDGGAGGGGPDGATAPSGVVLGAQAPGSVGPVAKPDGPVALVQRVKATRRFTTFKKLKIRGLSPGARVVVTCKLKKGKCPKQVRKAFRKRNPPRTLTLKKFQRIPFEAGTVIEVTVTKPGASRSVIVIKVRKGKRPRVVTS